MSVDRPDESPGEQPAGGRSGGWPAPTSRPSFADLEREILERWREADVFQATLRWRAGGPLFTFYEGPPTANGRPGTHHAEARVFKDIFPRYRTMKGYDVPRKGGWDCHGLPVELEVERELGLNSKAEIERFGIEEFNRRCRESVLRYVGAWEQFSERLGFWVDLDDAYRTMDDTYVESVWWALERLWDDGLIFEDFRVTPYCARCGTAVSDAEVAQGYRTVADPSIYVRFPLVDGPLGEQGAALLVWTTTPWTLHGNVCVAAGPDIRYQLVRPRGSDELLVVAADLRDAAVGEGAEVVAELGPGDLLGLHYRPPFELVAVEGDAHRVVTGDFVTTGEGTGLVHCAPAFGAEDLELGRREGLPVVSAVNLEGKFSDGPWSGQFVKDADPAIVADLEDAGLLLREDRYEHTYPFCWRCQTPLIYYAKPSWYIRTTARRDELVANNRTIDWHPPHIRDGRMGNWLENNVDWALSRDRYWGTPLPFWRCGACAEVTVVGSRAELGDLAGRDLGDLDPHRPYVDEVVLACRACGGDARRVPDVADAWFDSGAMPFAQFGYPAQGHDEFERHFPADFICEAIDQTRGWFYSLLAESTLLFGASSYRTCLCLGHIVDEEGRKMSKSLGNVLDPIELMDRHGADALRWLMLAEGNPWVNRRVGHQLLEDVVRQFLLTLWNTHVFFTTYARLDGFHLDDPPPAVAQRPVMDRWVLAELADLCDTVDAALDRYDVSTACRRLEGFVDDLSNWYVRRGRRRFWRAATEDPEDKAAAYHTLHTALVTLAGLLAPFVPFLADRLWGDLVLSQDPDGVPSVHLTDWPVAEGGWRDDGLRAAMATARRLVELGRQARNDAAVKVRQPLARALVTVPEDERAGLADLLAEIADELNVKSVEVTRGTGDLVERRLKPDFRALGPAFGRDAPAVAAAVGALEGPDADRLLAELAGGAATVVVDGTEREIVTDMVQVVETPRTGWQLASDGPVSCALDVELTEDLRVEGAARELVRALNDQRKALGLALDDRVEIAIEASPAELDHLLADGGWYDTVAREVLADTVHRYAEGETVGVDLGDGWRAQVSVRP